MTVTLTELHSHYPSRLLVLFISGTITLPLKQGLEKNKKVVQIEFRDRKSLNKYNINFNGKGKNAHETFIFYSRFKNNPAEEIVEALDDKKD
jgi:hypothetical protein